VNTTRPKIALALPTLLIVAVSFAHGQDATAIPLREAEAKAVVKKLRPLLNSKTVLAADAITNSVVIKGSADELKRAMAIVERLDFARMREIMVVKMEYTNASQIATAATLVLYYFNDESCNRIVADSRTNSVLICGGTKDNAKRIVSAIQFLDAMSK
jgi:type II secretory pathway component GspD/PulD (secretin)